MTFRFFPFRYKLTLLISSIVVLIVTTVFLVTQNNIEDNFRQLTHAQFLQTEVVVEDKLKSRFEALLSDALFLESDQLLRTVITSDTYDQVTKNDVITSEVLPNLITTDFALITDPTGAPQLETPMPKELQEEILNSDTFETTRLNALESVGYVLFDDGYVQFIALPIFIGDHIIGIVVCGKEINADDLLEIKKASNTDLMIANKDRILTYTDWERIGTHDLKEYLAAFENNHLSMEGDLNRDETKEIRILEERFLWREVNRDGVTSIPYILIQSLDKQLLFIDKIREQLLLISLIAIATVIFIAFVFAAGISRPIKTLQRATEEVEKENFDHRVLIETSDEFSNLAKSFNQMITDLAEKAKIRQALDKSVSHSVADHILSNGLNLGGQICEASILFSDIRSFTSLSEKMKEDDLISMLNEYLSDAVVPITEQKGTIDKFIGDAIMALFGIPIADEGHAFHAVAAALNMVKQLEEKNPVFESKYGQPLKIGIGINSGDVVAGMVGAEERLNYTVLGDAVNLSSRIEGLTKTYGVEIIISESTYNMLSKAEKDTLNIRALDTVTVRGKSEAIKIFEVAPKPLNHELLKGYEVALDLHIQGQSEQARNAFEALNAKWPDDGPTQFMLSQL